MVRSSAKADARVLHVSEVTLTLPALLELARARSVQTRHVTSREASLEDVFVHLTGSELRDG